MLLLSVAEQWIKEVQVLFKNYVFQEWALRHSRELQSRTCNSPCGHRPKGPAAPSNYPTVSVENMIVVQTGQGCPKLPEKQSYTTLGIL